MLQGGMHGGEPHRLQASQQVFQEMGNPAINPQLTEAVLADSLYRSVTERLQSGAGPASFNQVGTLLFATSSFHPALPFLYNKSIQGGIGGFKCCCLIERPTVKP